MGETSQKQIEANRRNAQRSSGPTSAIGKMRSRANSLKHGMAAEVLVPEGDRAAFEAEMARWERDGGPGNAFEAHLVRRAAVGSVRLRRIERAGEEGRERSAQKAVASWEKKRQASARRKAQDLARDPANVVLDLEANAFGCEWLIRQWRSLDAPLAAGQPWDHPAMDHAQHLLGFPTGTPGPAADPAARSLWLLAVAAWPARFAPLGRSPSEGRFPELPDAALVWLRRFIAEEVDRLQALADASWQAVEGPDRDAVIAEALAADTSKEGQLRHRYEVAADRSCSGAIRLFQTLRDRRFRENLTIAKEAGRSGGILRVPVGGGWWHEVDSDPAPPGFARVAPEPIPVVPDSRPIDPVSPPASPDFPTVAPSPAPIDPTPPLAEAVAAPEPSSPLEPPAGAPSPTVPPTPAPARRAVDRPLRPSPFLAGAPQRNEPISAADGTRNFRHKSLLENSFQTRNPDPLAGVPWRTDPISPPNRPDIPPSHAPDPATRPAPDRLLEASDRGNSA